MAARRPPSNTNLLKVAGAGLARFNVRKERLEVRLHARTIVAFEVAELGDLPFKKSPLLLKLREGPVVLVLRFLDDASGLGVRLGEDAVASPCLR